MPLFTCNGRAWATPKLSPEQVPSISPAELAHHFFAIPRNTPRPNENIRQVLTAAFCHMQVDRSVNWKQRLQKWKDAACWRSELDKYNCPTDHAVPSYDHHVKSTTSKRQREPKYEEAVGFPKHLKIEVRGFPCSCQRLLLTHFRSHLLLRTRSRQLFRVLFRLRRLLF